MEWVGHFGLSNDPTLKPWGGLQWKIPPILVMGNPPQNDLLHLTSSKIEVGEFSSWWIYGYVRISLQVPSFYSIMSVIASIHVKSKEIRMIGLNFLRCKYFQRPGHPLLRCPSSTIVANSILDFWDWGDDSGELWCFDGFDAMHFSLRLWLFCSILQVFHSVLWNFTWFYWEILGRCF